jgi:putative Mg2+ transporter-C (MgtC) family protein
MTGVGFLGAGVILKTGVSIQGLTTAACIWIVSAIGLAIGAGQYVAGVTGFTITFISLWFLRLMEIKIPTMAYKYVTVVTDSSGDEEAITSIFQDSGFKINKMDYDIEITKGEKKYIFTVSSKNGISMKEVIDAVTSLKFAKKLEIRS